MANSEPAQRFDNEMSKDQGNFVADVKPFITNSSDVISSLLESNKNQVPADSSKYFHSSSSSAVNFSKTNTCAYYAKDDTGNPHEMATLPFTPLCHGKPRLPQSNTSYSAPHHQDPPASNVEETSVIVNNENWLKTERAGSAHDSSNETQRGESISNCANLKTTIAETDQCQAQCGDNHSKERDCFACWICFEQFKSCLDVKTHILKKHKNSKVLCAYTQLDSKNPSIPPQLLMYCPNKCDYVTAKLYAFPHHVATCDKPALHNTGMAYLNSSGNIAPGNIVDKENENKRKTRSRSTRLKNSQAGTQKETSGKVCESENDTAGAEKWNDNFTCQRCKLIFSSSFFLQRHEKHCCSGSVQECSPEKEELLTRMPKNDVPSPPQSRLKLKKSAAKSQPTPKKRKEYTCKICKQIFNHVKSFRAHVKRHTNKPFKCTLCDRAFRTNVLLDAHIRVHKGQEPFQCEKCGKSYKRANSLYEHQLTHTEERPFKCEECGRGFQKKCILTSHMRTHTGEKPYQCSVCGKSFAQCGSLSKHLKTHLEEKPYVCNECGVSFKEKRTHIIHMRKHKGEELFQCEQCGKCCYHSAMLRRHMMTHTDEKPFVCSECGKRFRKATDLKRHMRVHTGEKPYQCKVCSKRFARSAHLTVHQRSHTGEKPYHCKQCDKRFMHNISLRIHTKSHHEKQSSQTEHKPIHGDLPQSCQVPRFWGDNPIFSGAVPIPGTDSILSSQAPHGWFH